MFPEFPFYTSSPLQVIHFPSCTISLLSLAISTSLSDITSAVTWSPSLLSSDQLISLLASVLLIHTTRGRHHLHKTFESGPCNNPCFVAAPSNYSLTSGFQLSVSRQERSISRLSLRLDLVIPCTSQLGSFIIVAIVTQAGPGSRIHCFD